MTRVFITCGRWCCVIASLMLVAAGVAGGYTGLSISGIIFCVAVGGAGFTWAVCQR